jgi:uncharacterized membrane protein YcaP (DUF421 family)
LSSQNEKLNPRKVNPESKLIINEELKENNCQLINKSRCIFDKKIEK